MRTTILISLCAVLASVCSLAAGQPGAAVDKSNGFNEHLSFNDDLIPPGWAVTFPYGGPGRNADVTDKRFQVEEVDTYGCLEKAKTLPAGDNTIDLSFRCRVRNVPYGMGYQIHVLLQDGSDFVVGLGKIGSYTNLMDVFAGDYQALSFNQTYAPDYGVYFLATSFRDNSITFTVTKKGSTVPLVSQTIAVAGLTVSQLSTVRLLGIMTTGAPAWIDDAFLAASAQPSP